MIKYFIFLIFIRNIFNYYFSFHIYADHNFNISKVSLIRTIYVSSSNNEEIIGFDINNSEEEIYYIFKYSGSNPNYDNYIYGYIELDYNCSLLLTNNSLLNVNRSESLTYCSNLPPQMNCYKYNIINYLKIIYKKKFQFVYVYNILHMNLFLKY